MAKHLPPFKLLKGLLLAICLSIIAVLPVAAALPSAPEDSKPSLDSIHTKPLRIFRGFVYDLDRLISNEIVTGIPRSEWRSYVPSSDDPNVECTDTTFKAGSESFTVTFTHTEYPDLKFKLSVTSLLAIANVVRGVSLYKGQTKVIQLPENYLEGGNEKILLQSVNGNDPSSIAKLDIDTVKKIMTLEGLETGQVQLAYFISYTDRVFSGTGWPINIYELPSADNITVNDSNIIVPTSTTIYLSDLIANNVVEGVNGGNADFTIESFVTENVYISDNYNYISISSPLTTTVTYTHKDFPDVKFSIDVTAKNGPAQYIRNNLRTIYTGSSKTITIPDDYLSLCDFTLTKQSGSSDEVFDFSVDGNQLTINGLLEGQANLYFNHRFGQSVATIYIAKKPSGQEINVIKDPILVRYSAMTSLRTLIQNGVINGIPNSEADNYVASCNDSNFLGYGSSFQFKKSGNYVVTYTHLEFPDIKFDVNVSAQYGISTLVSNMSVYVGQPYTISIPDNVLPLTYYTSIMFRSDNGQDPNEIAKLDIDSIQNTLTITAIKSGKIDILFRYYLGGYETQKIDVLTKPSADNIKVKGDYYYAPYYSQPELVSFVSGYGRNLVEIGEIEGISLSEWKNYIPSCDDSNIVVNYDSISGEYSFLPTATGTYSVTYTNKFFPEINFNVNYIFKICIDEATIKNRIVYPGQKIEFQLPDDCIPLSAYTTFEVTSRDGREPDSIGVVDIDPVNNKITLTGVNQGTLWIHYMLPIINTSRYRGLGFTIIVSEKPTVEEEPEIDVNGEGEILTNVNQKVKLVVPKAVAEAAGDQPLIWKSSDEGIATVDGNGVVTPTALGLTILTASIENTTSRANETVLMTLEFWVTDLIAEVPETISVGSSAQASYIVDAGKDSYDKEINPEWTSSDPSVVAIDNDGNMTGISEGTATITLKTDIGTKTVLVTVESGSAPAEPLSISPSDVALTVGSRLSLSAKGAGGKKVVWRTSDSFVAQIDENGVITAITPGTAIITATIEGTSTQATIRATVFERTTGIEEAEASEPVVKAENLSINVSGIASDLPVEIYNVSGRLIASRKGSCSVAVGQTGIYIVRIGGIVRKVAVTR